LNNTQCWQGGGGARSCVARVQNKRGEDYRNRHGNLKFDTGNLAHLDEGAHLDADAVQPDGDKGGDYDGENGNFA